MAREPRFELRTADSLDMRQIPSVYTVYAALLIAAYPSVFGLVLGRQIYFLSRCPVYQSSTRGITFCETTSFCEGLYPRGSCPEDIPQKRVRLGLVEKDSEFT
jgi:hypothetical protein